MISIILPTYNRPELILEAINSIDHTDCEVIIINDGSESDYSQALKLCEKKNIPYTYVKKKHEREPAALNLGIAMARGDLITILHDDDMLTECSLQSRASVLNDKRLMVVWGDSLKLKDGNITPCKSGIPDKHRCWKNDYVAFNTLMWRKRIHNVIGNFDTSLMHEYDYDWKLRLMLNYADSGACGYITSAVMVNRIHDARLTSHNTPETIEREHSYIHEKYKDLYK